MVTNKAGFNCLYSVDMFFSATYILPNPCQDYNMLDGFSEVRLESPVMGTTNVYPNNYHCEDHLVVHGHGAGLNFTFERIDLEPPDEKGNCNDYIQLFEGMSSKEGMELSKKMCGSIRHAPFYCLSNHMTIVFHTDGQKQYSGFCAHYDKLTSNTIDRIKDFAPGGGGAMNEELAKSKSPLISASIGMSA